MDTRRTLPTPVPASSSSPSPPPPKAGNERRRKSSASEKRPTTPLSIDKIHIVNTVTEMLIANWREVVKQMKSLDVLGPQSWFEQEGSSGWSWNHTPMTESFAIERPASLHDYLGSHRRSSSNISPRSQTPSAPVSSTSQCIVL